MASPRRHFILTNGRSGSNYFVQVLNQHPHVVNFGEVLGPWTPSGRHLLPRFSEPGRFLDWMMKSRAAFYAGQGASAAGRLKREAKTHLRRRSAIASIGVKDFAINFQRMGAMDYFAERPDIALVTLERRNVVERFLSSRLLQTTGEVKRVEGASASGTSAVTLDPGTIRADLDEIAEENAWIQQMADAHEGPKFALVYEDFFGGSSEAQAETLAELQRFLGVAPQTLAAEHRKLRQASLRDSIENFDAVAEALSGTPYEAEMRA
ncbi:MAG: hypothetical protein AAGH41_14020 [Pseudomonadota bacterium]